MFNLRDDYTNKNNDETETERVDEKKFDHKIYDIVSIQIRISKEPRD